MQDVTSHLKSARLLAICFLVIAETALFQVGCQTAKTVEPIGAVQKLPAPRALPRAKAEEQLDPFEKQFRIDTGETELTRRVEFVRPMQTRADSKERLSFKYDLSAWPESVRSLARLWVAVGAPSTLSSEGPLGIGFAQNGVGMATQIDNTYNVDGTMLMGSDFAVADGEVSIEIKRLGHPPGTAYTVHSIVYLPKKSDVDASK